MNLVLVQAIQVPCSEEGQAVLQAPAGDPWQGLDIPEPAALGSLLPRAREGAQEQDYLGMFGFPDEQC